MLMSTLVAPSLPPDGAALAPSRSTHSRRAGSTAAGQLASLGQLDLLAGASQERPGVHQVGGGEAETSSYSRTAAGRPGWCNQQAATERTATGSSRWPRNSRWFTMDGTAGESSHYVAFNCQLPAREFSHEICLSILVPGPIRHEARRAKPRAERGPIEFDGACRCRSMGTILSELAGLAWRESAIPDPVSPAGLNRLRKHAPP